MKKDKKATQMSVVAPVQISAGFHPIKSLKVRWFIRRLSNKDMLARRSAAEALEKLGALTTELNVRRYIKDLGKSGSGKTGEEWYQYAKVRQSAAEALGKIGPEAKTAVPILIRVLEDTNEYVRKSSVEALGKIGNEAKNAIPALITKLEDHDSSVRNYAAEALEKLGALTIELKVKWYIKDLRDTGRGGWRKNTINSLAKTGKAAVPPLIKALEDEKAEVREGAAEALGKLGHEAKEAIPSLIRTLEDEYEGIRKAAAEALERLGALTIELQMIRYIGDLTTYEIVDQETHMEKRAVINSVAIENLVRIGKPAVPALTKALEDKYLIVREAAVKTLGAIGPEAKEAIPALIKLLEDDTYERESIPVLEQLRLRDILSSVAIALGKIGPQTKDVIPALVKALEGKNDAVGAADAKALGYIGQQTKDVIPAIIKTLEDENGRVRESAAIALGKIGPQTKDVIPALVKALEDKYWHLCTTTAKILGTMGSAAKSAIPTLIKILESKGTKNEDYAVREAVATALGNIGSDAKAAIPSLIEASKDEYKDEAVSKAAKEAIRKIESTPS